MTATNVADRASRRHDFVIRLASPRFERVGALVHMAAINAAPGAALQSISP